MERIKQAIEREKMQRSSKSKPAIRSQAQNLPPYITKESANPQEPENVHYTHTRVVKLPPEHLEKNRIVAFDKNSPLSSNFDLLRTLVLKKMDAKGWRTMAITSPTPEAGKSMVAINLAISIAQQTNKTAILVDFDLRRPKIGSYLGIPMEKSLNDLLEGQSTLSEALVNPDIPRLVILPTKKSVRNSSETLSSRKISDLIKDVRERYESRIVIFDLPPLLVADDSIALLPQVDCILLVVANGMSTRQEIEESLRLLPAENLIGTVFNKAEVETGNYYY